MSDALKRAAHDALVEMVERRARWDFFATLTFASDVTEATARRALRTWLRTVAREVAGDHFPYFAVMGPQPDSGRLHLHALFAFEGAHERTDRVLGAWRKMPGLPTGGIEMQPYDASRKAIRYMVEGHPDWETDTACTRSGDCAHRRCARAWTGWT